MTVKPSPFGRALDIWHRYQRTQHPLAAELTSTEFERFYLTGELPEREWPQEIDALRTRYAAGEFDLTEFEERLDDMMGLPARRQSVLQSVT